MKISLYCKKYSINQEGKCMGLAEGVGYVALILNLYSMASKNEFKLRIISAIANLIYIGYGVLIGAVPIILGCSVAVTLHGYRLYRMKTTSYGTNTSRS